MLGDIKGHISSIYLAQVLCPGMHGASLETLLGTSRYGTEWPEDLYLC